MFLREYIREKSLYFYQYKKTYQETKNQLEQEIEKNIKDVEKILEKELRELSFLFVFKKLKIRFLNSLLDFCISITISPTNQQKKKRRKKRAKKYQKLFRFSVKGLGYDLFRVKIQNECLLEEIGQPSKLFDYIATIFNDIPNALKLAKLLIDYKELRTEPLTSNGSISIFKDWYFIYFYSAFLLKEKLGNQVEVNYINLQNEIFSFDLSSSDSNRIVIGKIFPKNRITENYKTISVSRDEDPVKLEILVADELLDEVTEALDTIQLCSKEFDVVPLDITEEDLKYDRV